MGSFRPSAFREEAALLSEGENMFAFQICNVPDTDQKVVHHEFLGCIAEGIEDETPPDSEDNKRGKLLVVDAVFNLYISAFRIDFSH